MSGEYFFFFSFYFHSSHFDELRIASMWRHRIFATELIHNICVMQRSSHRFQRTKADPGTNWIFSCDFRSWFGNKQYSRFSLMLVLMMIRNTRRRHCEVINGLCDQFEMSFIINTQSTKINSEFAGDWQRHKISVWKIELEDKRIPF